MPQFKTNGKGFNRAIGLQAWQWQWCTLPLLTFPQNTRLLTKKKKQKESFYNNNNLYYFVEANLKAMTFLLYIF